MLNYLDTDSLIALGFFVFVSSFFMGSLMHGIFGEDGFGVGGNTFVMSAGAFLGFYVLEAVTMYRADAVLTAVAGVSGAFICLATLAILKATLNRAGY